LGKRRLARVRSRDYDSSDFFEGSGKSSFMKIERERVKTFTEKSWVYWREFVCGSCKRLMYSRKERSWVCGRGHSITKEYCADWVDDVWNIRIGMPDGCVMFANYE
jgi:hypothetical protein